MFAEGSQNQEEIVATGDAGKVECRVPASEVTIGRRRPRRVETLQVPVDERILAAGGHHGSTYYEHVAFQRAVREGSAPEVSADDGLRAVAMGVAAERSIALGRAVEMAELGF
jgi:predicted dehydrogenase